MDRIDRIRKGQTTTPPSPPYPSLILAFILLILPIL